ncbi:tetratricopeptide repeat protein [Flavobacterium sp. J372]|uniref:tetratricopeptide repeat protein n=1 Tax=Flavobacterium sp. J372 TaxID=2898436 RepID=UPI0021513A15|nr:tetratricopeptide repeat protein [Flavobacterium sp. J372]MCR5860994.1 tetratricopeptide repeat protein [Flavobacterium sp. J372]
MKKTFALLFFLLTITAFCQNEQLAHNYFEKGEFEKALSIYQDMEKKQPGNTFFIQKIAASYQQLQRYADAEKYLLEKLQRMRHQPQLLVELGYNYQLQKNQAKADKLYKEAIDAVKENPGHVYMVANTFEQKVLIQQALQTYEAAQASNKSMNFDYQIALLQGQIGNTDLMIEKLLSYSYTNQQNLPLVQNQLTRFMNEEQSEGFVASLRKALLLNTQKNQDIFWNQFMSWFFVQQKDYGKAFIQEKAIFKRNPEYFSNIVNLARLSVMEKENETAKEILTFILNNTQDAELQITAHNYLLDLDIEAAQEKDYPAIKQRIDVLLSQYGTTPTSLQLQLNKADFAAFYLKDTKTATEVLNQALKLPLNKYEVAEVKMKLSDILLLDEKFNQAIIYYAQIEEDLKNDAVGHEASLKVAKASYYKGDFEWAQKQLGVLKSSVSQLIANDALEIFLLITDNTVEDSTQTALKKFAKADFKLYQNKRAEALSQFKDIIANDKTSSIQDVTLLRIGKIYANQGQYDLALQHYQQIIDKYADGIYIDEALFFSAEIYNKKLNDPEKAKALYEKVLFSHQDSIYFVEARKQFRLLRGDTAS